MWGIEKEVLRQNRTGQSCFDGSPRTFGDAAGDGGDEHAVALVQRIRKHERRVRQRAAGRLAAGDAGQ